MAQPLPIEKLLLRPGRNIFGLYLGSFMSAFAWGLLLLVMPFVITNLGGSDKELGICIGINATAYIIACLVAVFVMDRFSPKRMLQISTAGMAIANLGIYLTVLLDAKHYLPFGSILITYSFMAIAGLVRSFFWPPIMGWISTGYEGRSLNRRLGMFNISWSLAIVISSLIGGYLAEINYTWPLIGIVVLHLFTFFSVSSVPSPRTDSVPPPIHPQTLSNDLLHPSMPRFRWMARIALVTSSIPLALVSTQLALLLTDNFGFSKSNFGIALMLMSLTSLIAVFVAGKTHLWHHKLFPLIAVQLMLMLSMLLILWSNSIWQFYAATLIIGIGSGFIYSSHQYYGVSGGKKRSGLMAIHELLLSAGFVFGAVIGGLLGEYINRYVPYWFCFTSLAVSVVIQLTIWFSLRSDR